MRAPGGQLQGATTKAYQGTDTARPETSRSPALPSSTTPIGRGARLARRSDDRARVSRREAGWATGVLEAARPPAAGDGSLPPPPEIAKRFRGLGPGNASHFSGQPAGPPPTGGGAATGGFEASSIHRTLATSRLLWNLGFVLLGILTTGCWWQIRLLGDVRLHLGIFFGWFASAFLVYLAALWLVRRADGTRPTRPLILILVVAAVARLLLITTEPTLSNDIYRYQWDGRVQLAGIDPYAYPPNDPAIAFLRDDATAQINFPQLRTVYPPIAELAFGLGAWLSDTLTAQKSVFVLAEWVTIFSLVFILIARGLSPLWVVAYAWHPLAILEIAGSGHNDALGIAFLWLGLAAWQGRRWWGATVAWALAFLSKFLSVMLVPWWWFRQGSRRWLGVFLALAALPFMLRPTAVSAFFESFSAVSGRVESNASVFLLLLGVFGSPAAARLFSTGLLVGFLIWWGRREPDPARYLFGGLIVMALLSPVLHPWYVVWLIPCCCFWRVPAVLALTGTVVLAYTVWPGYLADGTWSMPVWARLAEYLPVALLFLLGVRPRSEGHRGRAECRNRKGSGQTARWGLSPAAR